MNLIVTNVKVEMNNVMLYNALGQGIATTPGKKEITFEAIVPDPLYYEELQKIISNNNYIKKINSSFGYLVDCFIESMNTEYGNDKYKCLIKGEARDLLETMEVKFKDKESDVMVKHYNTVKNYYKKTPENLTLDEFNDYVMVEEL
jgi:hypothetical protein